MSELDEIRGRWEKATPGPWYQGRERYRYENIREVYNEREPSATSHDICTAVWSDTDAEFIAHAPSDVARLLNATQGVLDLHRPSRRNHTSYNSDGTLIAYTVVNDGPCVTCYPPHITQHCEECEDYDDTCAGVEGNTSHPWPCPTVAAITAALEAKP